MIHRLTAASGFNGRILEVESLVIAECAHHFFEFWARVLDRRPLLGRAAAEIPNRLEELSDVARADEFEVLEIENHFARDGVRLGVVFFGDFAEGFLKGLLALVVDFPIQRDQHGVVGFLDF